MKNKTDMIQKSKDIKPNLCGKLKKLAPNTTVVDKRTSSDDIEKPYTSVLNVTFGTTVPSVGNSSGARYLTEPANLDAVKP